MKLGIFITVATPEESTAKFSWAEMLGFDAVQVHFPQGCTELLAQAVAMAAEETGVAILAASGYANTLQPEAAPMGSTLAGMRQLIGWLPLMRTPRVVCWSGTYADDLLSFHPDNHSQRAWRDLRQTVESLIPMLEEANAMLVLEPFHTHVLGTPERIVHFLQEVGSPRLGVVLDPPNLLPADSWSEQSKRITHMIQELAPRVGLIHLKDMRLEGDKVVFPGPGDGILDYATFLKSISAAHVAAPWIIEHVTASTAGTARDFIQETWRRIRHPGDGEGFTV